MQLKKLALAAGAVTLAVGGGSAAADGGGGGRWKTVHVQFTPTDLVFTNEGVACDAAHQCVTVSTITATLTGDLVGSTVQATAVGFNGVNLAKIPQNVTGTVTGTVNGCGTGGFLYSGSGNVDGTTNQSTMTYTIVEGTGTGELTGITGELRQRGPADVISPISGTLRCRPPG